MKTLPKQIIIIKSITLKDFFNSFLCNSNKDSNSNERKMVCCWSIQKTNCPSIIAKRSSEQLSWKYILKNEIKKRREATSQRRESD